MQAHPTIDECLSTRDGHLYIEDCAVTDLVEEHGSPIFITSEKKLRLNLRRFQAAFAKYWPHGPVEILPAFKANTTLATRRILSLEGAGADIYSDAEFHGLMQTGVEPEKVSVNGGGKSLDLLRKCVEAGVRITIEDLDEPRKIDAIAKQLGVKAKVRLRLKASFPNLNMPTEFAVEKVTADFGNQLYKSGIPTEYLVDLGKEILALEHLELVGFHMHLGRHLASLKYWEIIAEGFANLIADLCRAWDNYQPKELDLGGGFASHRDPFFKTRPREDVLLTWWTWPFMKALGRLSPNLTYKLLSQLVGTLLTKAPSSERSPSVEEYGRVVATTLSRALEKRGVVLENTKLQVEPGRAMYGDTTIHAARVKKVKRQTKPIKMSWILTDTTMFFFSYSFFEHNLHDFRIANKACSPPTQVADIVGHSCYVDRLLPWVHVPNVEEGDVVAFFDAGAYTDSSAGNFNALPRPATILVNGKDSYVIRAGEEIEDVFRRDNIPEHLRR